MTLLLNHKVTYQPQIFLKENLIKKYCMLKDTTEIEVFYNGILILLMALL